MLVLKGGSVLYFIFLYFIFFKIENALKQKTNSTVVTNIWPLVKLHWNTFGVDSNFILFLKEYIMYKSIYRDVSVITRKII